MIHQAPTRFARRMLCELTYDQIGRLSHSFVWSQFDAHKVTCPDCKHLRERAEQRSTAA